MVFRSCMPCAPLDRFIENLWYYEGYTSLHQRERILPTGTFELVFNLLHNELRIYGKDNAVNSRLPGALVAGPYGTYFVTDSAEEACVMGVHFKPGGAFPFLDPPAAELADAHFDLRDIWGTAAEELRARLATAPSIEQRFALLERALLARLAVDRTRHPAVPAALAAFRRRMKVREVVREVDLSERRFVHVFTAEIGLRPKTFSRIQRFQNAVALASGDPEPDWTGVALECGYFDQAHLINDFREFSGLSPGDYARRLRELRSAGARLKWNHLPVGA